MFNLTNQKSMIFYPAIPSKQIFGQLNLMTMNGLYHAMMKF